MKHQVTHVRQAFTLAEFAGLFGKHRSWAYRQVTEGRVKTINGFGAAMVPAHEIDRILGTDPNSISDTATPVINCVSLTNQ